MCSYVCLLSVHISSAIMLRQTIRLCSRTKCVPLHRANQSGKCRHLSSSQAASSHSSRLPLIAGGLAIGGGSALLAYRNGFFDSKKDTTEVSPQPQSEPKPVVIENLPESVPYLIIGSGTAAVSASRTIRSSDPNAKVLIISEENYHPYMRPPLSKELWFNGLDVEKEFTFTQYNGLVRNIFFEPEEFYLPLGEFNSAPHGGICLVKGHRVARLDPTERRVYLDNGQSVVYEKCLLATVGKPKNVPALEKVPPEMKNRVIRFNTVDDFKQLHQLLPESKSITIIGGEFLASELAVALAYRSRKSKSNLTIRQIVKEEGILRHYLPPYLSQWCTQKFRDEGVNVIPNADIESVHFDKNQLCLTLTSGECLETDLCVVATGLQPDTALAESAQLELDPVRGGYVVNQELQARSNLWVAGDCASYYDPKFGRRRTDHHDHAVVTGRLAGENMTGSAKPYWKQSMFWSDLGLDIGFEAIGLVDSSLPTFAVFNQEDDDSPDGGDSKPKDKYSKGVIFYLQDKSVVGLVLWNLYSNMHLARRVIFDGSPNRDLNELAKLFSIYEPAIEANSTDSDDKEKPSE